MDEELKVMEENIGEEVKEEKQNRFRSWAVWVSVAGAVWIILQAFGLTERWGINHDVARTVFNAIGTILIGFGILNDPTNPSGF